MANAENKERVRSIALSPDLAELACGRQFLAQVATEAGFSSERVFDITVACSEAMANAIEHSPVRGEVHVRTLLHEDRLEVEIEGPGEFQAPARLKERANRGLGLPLMAKLSDHLALFSGPRGQTFVSLSFYLPGVRVEDEGPVPPAFANLSHENRLLDEILRNFPEGFFVLDDDWRFIYVNPSVLSSAGKTVDDLLGAVIWEIFPDYDAEGRRGLEMAKAEAAPVTVTAHGADGLWREWTAFPVDEGLAVISRDITERREGEEKLRDAEQELKAFFESAGFMRGIVEIVDDINVLHVRDNRVTADFLGTTPAALENKLSSELGEPPEVVRAWVEHYRESQRTGAPVTFEYPDPRGNGQCWLSATVSYLRQAPSGRPQFAYVAADVTDRKRAEDQALAERQHLEAVLEYMPVAVVIVDAPEGKLSYINRRAAELYGFDSKDLSREENFARVKPKRVDGSPYPLDELPVSRALRGERVWAEELILSRPDGVSYPILGSASPLLDSDGKPVAAVVIFEDISDRKRSEAAAWESEERFRLALANTPVSVAAQDLDLRYIWAYNQSTARAEEVVGKTDQDLFPQEAERLTAIKRELLRTKEARRERLWVTRPGRRLFLDVHYVPMLDAGGEVSGIWMTTVDLTEQRLAEDALRQSEAALKGILDATRESIWVWSNPTGEIVNVNATAAQRFGKPAEEMVGKRVEELLPRELGDARLQRLREAVATRHPLEFEDERGEFAFHHFLYPTFNEAGDVDRVVMFSQDISERRRAEAALKASGAQLSFLLELSDALRELEDPAEIQAAAARVLGQRLGADRVSYVEVAVKDGVEYFAVEREYCTPGASARLVWSPVDSYNQESLAEYHAGRMSFSADVETDPMFSAGERETLGRFGVRAYVAAPLVKQERLVGVLGVAQLQPRAWTPDEVSLVRQTADRTWSAVQRARAEAALRDSEERYRVLAEQNEQLYRQQLSIAEALQFAFLHIPPEIGPVKLGHLYRSATEAARIGGDFYDVFEVKDGHIAILMGDVAGHGIEAARTATLVKDVVHAFVHQSLRTHEVLRSTNKLLLEKELPGFVTLFLGILDSGSGRLRYSSAGHPETLLRRGSGQVERLLSASSPLGVYDDATWKPHAVDLEPGDVLLLYTDGVIEARHNGDFFGEKRLEALLARRHVTAERLPHLVLDRVLAFSEGQLVDDIAVLALSLTGNMDDGSR